MKTRNTSATIIAVLIVIVSVLALSAVGGTGNVKAERYTEESSVPIGIAAGQTARLNLVNTGYQGGISVEWEFYDSAGRTLAESAGPQLIPPGQTRSFDLNADELDAVRDQFGRIQMWSELDVLSGRESRRFLGISLEVFNNSDGRTAIAVWLHPAPESGL